MYTQKAFDKLIWNEQYINYTMIIHLHPMLYQDGMSFDNLIVVPFSLLSLIGICILFPCVCIVIQFWT